MRLACSQFAGACALAVLAGSGCSQSEDDPDAFARSNYCAEVVATVAEGTRVNDIELDGNLLYYSANNGFFIFDVTDLTHPIQIGSYDGQFDKFARTENRVMLHFGDRAVIVDVSNPPQITPVPVELGPFFDYHSPAVSHGGYFYACAADYNETPGLLTINALDAEAQTLTPMPEGWVWIEGKIEDDILVTGGDKGLDLFDVSEPAQPRRMASVRSVDILELAVYNHTAYATGYDNGGIEGYHAGIIDLLDPLNPFYVRSIEPYPSVVGSGYMVADVRVYDLADRLNPKWIGMLQTLGYSGVFAGTTLYLAVANAGGLQILDLSGCRAQEQ